MDFVPSLVQGGGTFIGTTLTGAVIVNSTISGSVISLSTISGATIVASTLSGATFIGGTLSGTSLVSVTVNSGSTVSVYSLPIAQFVHVTRNGVDQGSVNHATTTQVNYTTQDFDTASVFSTSTDRMTPNIAGKYLCIFAASFVDSVASDQISSMIYKNGSQVARADIDVGGTNDAVSAIATKIVDMNGTTDYLEHFVRQSNVATTNRALYGSTDKTFMQVMRLSA